MEKSASWAKAQKPTSPRQQAFTTYRDFASDQSLESEEFEPEFDQINGSFYSSSNVDQEESFLANLQGKEETPRRSKVKEEMTNYTAKPPVILETVEIKKSNWCHNCIYGSKINEQCLLF
jgi:hypothetical protein